MKRFWIFAFNEPKPTGQKEPGWPVGWIQGGIHDLHSMCSTLKQVQTRAEAILKKHDYCHAFDMQSGRCLEYSRSENGVICVNEQLAYNFNAR